RMDCSNVSDLTRDPDRIVEVEWDAGPEDRFNARMRIFAEDRQNLLRDIAEVVSKQDVNIVELNLFTEGSIAVGTLVVNVRGLAHLSRLMARIQRIKGVVQVERVGVADVAEKMV
ncbi:MAG TPA: bifunctional (p)ppGpp synthetase/guanosine-3',5'-bis(diphosphate) 3'-pyrophosphohydrolase, partial [Bacteroidetes bacterium]|nr:bifunctional (p)ppGpp synthetase/guanosine-3',5'-bis(diphosphate) 3'-pyrophosphohydrolase [Bacteroidota bacterium]